MSASVRSHRPIRRQLGFDTLEGRVVLSALAVEPRQIQVAAVAGSLPTSRITGTLPMTVQLRSTGHVTFQGIRGKLGNISITGSGRGDYSFNRIDSGVLYLYAPKDTGTVALVMGSPGVNSPGLVRKGTSGVLTIPLRINRGTGYGVLYSPSPRSGTLKLTISNLDDWLKQRPQAVTARVVIDPLGRPTPTRR